MSEFEQEKIVDDREGTAISNDGRDALPNRSVGTASGSTWVNKGGWGRSEAVIVGSFGVILLLCVAYLLFFVNPEKSAALERRTEVQALEKQLLEARERYGRITSTEEQVARLIGSADRFETGYLPAEASGKTALYKRISDLISGNGLINTAGPSYRGLELQESQAQNGTETDEAQATSSRLRSIFPGVLVSVTVEGSYSKVRNFLKQLETSEQFIVISSVALEPSDRSQSASQVDEVSGSRTSTKSRGDVVSLKIEFAAYFRRPGNSEALAVAGIGN